MATGYYFFIVDKKKELERQGIRFRSIQDVFAMENLREEWKGLDPNAQSKYDQLAKEAKENDRVSQERREEELKEEILSNLTMEGPGLNGQKFVVFKSIDVCEVGYPPDSEFLPAELAIGSFSIATGHISNYHTLVDIVNTPLGYAAQAKDNFEATALPLPGSDKFKPAHRNYFKILQNLKRFIQSYVTPVHGFYPVFIKPDNDKPVDEQVLKWMVKESRRIGPYEGVDHKAEKELYHFFNYLKFLKVTKLLLRLGGVAQARCPTFRSHVASFNYLEDAAVHVLSAGVYDYFPNITCSYHNLSTEDTEFMKMKRCCRNIVLRTIFLILREVMPGMNVQPIMSHTPQSIKPQPPYQLEPKVPENEPKRDKDEVKEERPPPLPNYWNVPSGSRGDRVKRPLSKGIEDPYNEPCPSTLESKGSQSKFIIPKKVFRCSEVKDEKTRDELEELACLVINKQDANAFQEIETKLKKEMRSQRRKELAAGLVKNDVFKKFDKNRRKGLKIKMAQLRDVVTPIPLSYTVNKPFLPNSLPPATDNIGAQKIFETAVMHTTKGDIHIKLFVKECPKSAENFCVHAKNGYYNGNIFHRVIKELIQTGDPSGTGTGGLSVWDWEFEDEFHPSLRHEPYSVSMANSGPNTNLSQFFITTTSAPWLDNKHTVFGRVTRGMETVQSISLVKTNSMTDKPYEDVSIINISLK